MAQPTRIGFWSDGIYHASPQSMVDAMWSSAERDRVIAYLRSGRVAARYRGYSWCRFRCGIPHHKLGDCDLTDGAYVWPEGYAHYLEEHAVRPPYAFVAHVLHTTGRTITPGPGGRCRCHRCEEPADDTPERQGYCAQCFPVCAPDVGGSPRFPTLSVLRHTPPAQLAAAADALKLGAVACAVLFSRFGRAIRREHGLPAHQAPTRRDRSAPPTFPRRANPRHRTK